MGVTKVGNQKYRARYSDKGIRYNVGTFSTRKQAQDELERHQLRGGLEFEEAPIPQEFVSRSHKPTLKERVLTKWRSIKESLERKNLI